MPVPHRGPGVLGAVDSFRGARVAFCFLAVVATLVPLGKLIRRGLVGAPGLMLLQSGLLLQTACETQAAVVRYRSQTTLQFDPKPAPGDVRAGAE